MSDDKILLTSEQAISMLPDSDSIHTFRNSLAGILVGCDWDRCDLLDAIQSNKCEVGGEACQGMNHGLVIHVNGPLFVECRDDVDYEKFAAKEIR